MIRLISSGVGVDLESFKTARKNLRQLHLETADGDVRLFKNPNGHIVSSGVSAKLLIHTDDMWLAEVRREFINNGDIVEGIKTWSISETVQQSKGEKPLNGILRGLAQELEIYDCPVMEIKPIALFGERDTRPSKVYPGIISDKAIVRFEWPMKAKIHPQGKTFEDAGAIITLKWLDKY